MVNNIKFDNIDLLLDILPDKIKEHINTEENLIEIIIDLGRKPEARYSDNTIEYINDSVVSYEDLKSICNNLKFGDDNRAGIINTLHRISAIRDRDENIIGLTCRIGRAVYGSFNILKDLIDDNSNVLILGIPGSGKTTFLRDIARYISNDLKKRTIIVDTSNEIAGQGAIPHESVGRSRRMQVSTPSKQYAIMLEGVENHNPQVIIIDEIGTRGDVDAARTIAERGVQLFATAHGQTLANILNNPTLVELVGGVQNVTLSDSQAQLRDSKKTILERKHNPTFDVIVEIIDFDTVAVHKDVAKSVDYLLDNMIILPELRHVTETGEIVYDRGTDCGEEVTEKDFINEKILAETSYTTKPKAKGRKKKV